MGGGDRPSLNRSVLMQNIRNNKVVFLEYQGQEISKTSEIVEEAIEAESKVSSTDLKSQ